MTTFIVTFHIIFCILLILIVLLQSGKGAGMGFSLGGGGSQTLFGAAGPATILAKITTAVAILFMVTSLTLAYRSGHQSETTIMQRATGAPVEQAAPVVRTIPVEQAAPPVEEAEQAAPIEQSSGTEQTE